MRNPWTWGHQWAAHSYVPGMHAGHTHLSVHARLQGASCGWTGRCWLSKPSRPGHLSPGGHRKGLPEPAEDGSHTFQFCIQVFRIAGRFLTS